MRRVSQSLKAISVLAFLLLCASATIAQVMDNPISEMAMRNIRIYIDFEPYSGYENPNDQDEFRKSAKMGMKMWESILPSMHVYFVDDPSDANLLFIVGNYGGLNPDNACGGPGGSASAGGWTACSFYPDTNGNIVGGGGTIASGRIYFNTIGFLRFFHDRFDLFSRDALYKSFEPATYPPVGYGDPTLAGGLGYLGGRFKSELGGIDAAYTVFHEFGHSVGLTHIQGSASDALAFYGTPYPPGGSKPPTPHMHTEINTEQYPGLPLQYYGGGTSVWGTDPIAAWLPDIQPLRANLGHMVSWDWVTPTLPPGVPEVSTYKFNFRVVHTDDYNQLSGLKYRTTGETIRMNYPVTKGLIRLEKRSGQDTPNLVALTPSWKQAISLAQLDRSYSQSNPYFVTGVFNSNQNSRVASGAFHTLAIRNDGTLWAWGRNNLGQLGNGTRTDSPNPVQIGTGTTWVSVAAGENFSLALRSDNVLFAWGDRTYGQVGDNVFSSSSPVTAPKALSGTWAAAKAGATHAVALKTDGTLWCWGNNAAGQLGNADALNNNRASPVQEYTQFSDWTAVSAGSSHSAGLRTDGSHWAWGSNEYGTLGNPYYPTLNYPVQESFYSPYWTQTDAGHDHALGMNTLGDIFVWGRNQQGQLGTATTAPTQGYPLMLGSGFVSTSAGHWHNAAIKKDGSLWSWGWNSQGQLGANLPAGTSSAALVQESTRSADWLEVFPGKEQTLAMRTDGSLWAWGKNTYGQLGTGSASSNAVLAPVLTKFGDKVTAKLSLGLEATDIMRFAPNSISLIATSTSSPSLYLTAVAQGNIAKVEFLNGSTVIKTYTYSSYAAGPYKYTWPNVGRGQYALAVRVTDRMGKVATSSQFIVSIHKIDVAPLASTPATLNLTTEAGTGTATDWVQWGYNSTPNYITRKNLTTPLIAVNRSFPPDMKRYTNAPSGFTWTDGKSPVSQTTTQKQYVGTKDRGLWDQEVPASTSTRTMKLYVVLGPSTYAHMTFSIGQLGVRGPDLENTSSTATISRCITITYSAATSGFKGIASISTDFPMHPVGIQAMVYK